MKVVLIAAGCTLLLVFAVLNGILIGQSIPICFGNCSPEPKYMIDPLGALANWTYLYSWILWLVGASMISIAIVIGIVTRRENEHE